MSTISISCKYQEKLTIFTSGDTYKKTPSSFLKDALHLSFPALKQLQPSLNQDGGLGGHWRDQEICHHGFQVKPVWFTVDGFKNNIYLQHASIRNGNGLNRKDWSLFWQGYLRSTKVL